MSIQIWGKGDMIRRRWILRESSPDGSCWVTPTATSVCFQLWLNRLEGRVWWKETCIPAGRRTSKEPGHVEVNETGRTRRRARRVSPLISHRKDSVYLQRKNETSSPCSRGGQRSGQVKIMRVMKTFSYFVSVSLGWETSTVLIDQSLILNQLQYTAMSFFANFLEIKWQK